MNQTCNQSAISTICTLEHPLNGIVYDVGLRYHPKHRPNWSNSGTIESMLRSDTFKFVLVEKGQVVLGKDIKVRSENKPLTDTTTEH